MSEDDFLPGDVVALSSGGPAMTVREQRGELVVTDWFSGDECRSHVFHCHQLVYLDEPEAAGEVNMKGLH